MAAVFHRTADDLAREGTEIARQSLVVSITLKAQRLMPVVAVVARFLGAEPLSKPVVVFRPCVSGIPQCLGFALMPFPDFQFDLLGLGSSNAAHGVQQLPFPLPVLGGDGCITDGFLFLEPGHFLLVAVVLFTQLASYLRTVIFRGRDVVIPSGQVWP